MFNVLGNDTCNPFIEITCCDKIKFTTSREKVSCNSKNIVSWHEHLFIEPKNIVSIKYFSPKFKLRITL